LLLDLLLSLASVGRIDIRVDLAASAATGSAEGWAARAGLGWPEPPCEGPGCLVRDGFGLGAADGVDDAGPGGEDDGAGVVAVGTGVGRGGVVGAVDGDGTAEETVGDGTAAGSVGDGEAAEASADVGFAEVLAGPVVGCEPDPDVDPGSVTVEAAATPAPDEQAMAAVAAAVRAPRTIRMIRLA
jgi:hypothetical protein